ncbi:Oidioi.mRNA.OKI2018_I69.chr2.g6232.t1.cds [Oikopleura dioica]|uniref:Oidioi.mRNA.OKI2018_I69.chr2.g6232.t1.cds n=1 Tax=Oikopleura dioica TaxID=34765 RepID=A0ABN7T749_OIKDI|nr:Oidioi.mRNA.OKI2018_I69.chr2.g6232.t1.cds [Oikopleura dioica]
MCTNGYDMDCKRECHDEFTECRRSGTIDYADCRSDRQECYELCVCHHTHREFVNIKHPVRSCPPPRSNECDFVKQQLTVAPDFFHHSEWRCEYECLTKA